MESGCQEHTSPSPSRPKPLPHSLPGKGQPYPMSNLKAKGTSREHDVKRKLEAEGWVVVRSPASGSPVDLWAMRAWMDGLGSLTLAVQVKANAGSPWMNFRKEERLELTEIAGRAGASPVLCHWAPNKTCDWYPADKWPRIKERA